MEIPHQAGIGHFYHIFYEGCLTDHKVGEDEEASSLYPDVKYKRMDDYLRMFLWLQFGQNHIYDKYAYHKFEVLIYMYFRVTQSAMYSLCNKYIWSLLFLTTIPEQRQKLITFKRWKDEIKLNTNKWGTSFSPKMRCIRKWGNTDFKTIRQPINKICM